MNYYAYEMAHAFMSPVRFGVQALRHTLDWPLNPMAYTTAGKNMMAACDVFENITRRYGKPEFGIGSVSLSGLNVGVREEIAMSRPFCNLIHFARDELQTGKHHDPKVLIIAPMSGHYATLLRGTVEAMLPEHDVYITDWADARNVPIAAGRFDFDDFVEYIIDFVRFIGAGTHIIAVCQPAVPALVATALMAARNEEMQPTSLVLMGGPIDTRRNPTKVNDLAAQKSIAWFERNVILTVPFPHAGFMRPVYPGFMQLTGFMTMNLERHMNAHVELFNNLVKGDCDSVRQHQTFYEEYLSVMDLTAEFYLQTVQTVFQEHLLPDRKLMHRGEFVDCSAITRTALMTVEGERDDICGLGQTEAAHDLCTSIPSDEKVHYVQSGVGHYGVFNGTRWRTEIQPRIREFIRDVNYKRLAENGTTRIPRPHRPLRDTPDVAPDRRKKGTVLNGVNGSRPPETIVGK
ncbi:polyhydroxyalkanoate depolymerase, intracellular [Hyphomicrobium denitrificans 1NES1]|uniref:Polyhydroxyalkanoate depolymerase, intracellular n=1 Tax=Hyphomicrobium denitrificans 1NES1 TaxID=670307 RepID=N0B7Q7_9HYPH|nr:polyhydroxyalkanoate depolymerase [Hyphomicrobium denitrificans]AGK56556.1 polyhydroxyalkanoate depolymerase, intracellular [Hyphomicrobium denitrificans 1NES1]